MKKDEIIIFIIAAVMAVAILIFAFKSGNNSTYNLAASEYSENAKYIKVTIDIVKETEVIENE